MSNDTESDGSERTNAPVFKLASSIDYEPPEPSFTVKQDTDIVLQGANVEEIVDLLTGLVCPECGDPMAHVWHDTRTSESVIGCKFPVVSQACDMFTIQCNHGLYLIYPNQVELEDHRATLGKYTEAVNEMIDCYDTDTQQEDSTDG